MKTSEQIAQQLAQPIKANNALIGRTNRRRVKLGNGQGDPAPARPLVPREVFYRSASDQNDRGVAVLAEDAPFAMQALDGYYDVDVWIENVPGSTHPVITGPCDVPGLSTGTMSPMEGLVNAAAFPDLSRLVWFRIRPSVGGGIAVYVDVGWAAVAYQDGTGATAFFRSQDFGFPDPGNSLVYRPTTAVLSASYHRLIGIAFDPGTGQIVAIPGAARSTSEVLPSQESRSEFVDADYTAIDFTGLYPCGYVYSYYLQIDLVEDDFMRQFDPRTFSGAAGSGGSNLIDSIATDKFGTVAVDSAGNVAQGR
jgi:hypothetical protein